MNGTALLAEYRKSHAEKAFAELAQRYASLVFSTAKRRVGDASLAEEVAQSVFTRLAKSPPTVETDVELMGWLHRTTIHVAIDVWRSETRRKQREELAAAMQPAAPDPNPLWEELAPQVDEAVQKLGTADRQAVLLRYYGGKSMREVGLVLGVSEDAAKMRISRAIERLRGLLAERGVTCASATLGTLLTERLVEAAPATLMGSLGLAQLLQNSIPSASVVTTGMLPKLFLLMSKTKLSTAVIGLIALGLGFAGLRSVRQSSAMEETPSPTPLRVQTHESPRIQAAAASPNAIVGPGSPDDSTFETLKSELQAMLKEPSPTRGYPPPVLNQLLAKFGDRVREVVPILIDGTRSADSESRLWALSGLGSAMRIMRSHDLPEHYQAAFALARPVFGKVLEDEQEPDMPRLIALDGLVPVIPGTNGFPTTFPELDNESVQHVLSSLRPAKDREDGFRFTMIDVLAGRFVYNDDQAQLFVGALHSRLDHDKSEERLLAAYALATWPGSKPAEVKNELLAQLKAGSTYSFRAAQALGKLGSDAVDAVPELLAFAQAKREFSGGYADAALQAACRLQPELRTKYPEIDARLSREEAALLDPGPKSISQRELVTRLASASEGPEFQKMLLDGFQRSSPSELSAILQSFEALLPQVGGEERSALESFLGQARLISSDNPEGKTTPPIPSPASLLVNARVLLTDISHPQEAAIERALDHFFEQRGTTIGQAPASIGQWLEHYAALSSSLREIDPNFQRQWRQSLLKSTPWLDRHLPPEVPAPSNP